MQRILMVIDTFTPDIIFICYLHRIHQISESIGLVGTYYAYRRQIINILFVLTFNCFLQVCNWFRYSFYWRKLQNWLNGERGLCHSIYKHDAIDIADPSSMQDACHKNFLIDLAHRRVSVAHWKNIGARNPKVWGSIPHEASEFFSLSHARDKIKNVFHYFFTELKTYHLSHFHCVVRI